MSFISSQIREISCNNGDKSLSKFLLYPTLVLLENSSIQYINLETKSESVDENQKLDSDIIGYVVQNNVLWLLLHSGEILGIDPNKGHQIKITLTNFSNFKISTFRTDYIHLCLMSESGECLYVPQTYLELIQKMNEETVNIQVSLLKKRVPDVFSKKNHFNFKPYGLDCYIDANMLVLECPETGLSDIITLNSEIEKAVPWEEYVVLLNKNTMQVADLKNFDVIFQYDIIQENYCALSSHNKAFYYLLEDKEKMTVYCTWHSSMFEEAEVLDKEQSIMQKTTSQDVLKQQINTIVSGITPNNKPAELLSVLQPLTDKVTNFNFLISVAIRLCRLSLAYKTFLYNIQDRVYDTNNNEIIHLFCESLIKVDLLEYIVFKNIDCYKDIDFFNMDFKTLYKKFLSKSDFDLACICWLKYSELKLHISQDDIIDILGSIPHNVKMSSLTIWLKNFSANLLNENPFYIDIFVRWTSERIFLLEKSSYWPKIGLKLLEEIIEVLETSMKTIVIRPISMDDLDTLKDRLNYIQELKEKYKIHMKLHELISLNPSEVALIMLKRCYTEDLESFLQNYMPSYTARHYFEMDEVLKQYIDNEAACSGGGIDGARLQVILDAFHTNYNKLDSLLQILKVLDVPWTDNIMDLAVNAASSAAKDFTITEDDYIVAKQIQEEINYAKVKVILKKYNFPLVCVNYVLVLNKLINAPVVNIDDLKIITTVIPTVASYAHMLYIDRCLKDCETKLALDYFKELPSEIANAVTTRYEQIINSKSCNKTLEKNYIDFIRGTSNVNKIHESAVESLYHLKHSFNIQMSINNICNEKMCDDKVNSWLEDNNVTASSNQGSYLTKLTNKRSGRDSQLILLLRRTASQQEAQKLVELLITSTGSTIKDKQNTLKAALSKFHFGKNTSLLIDAWNIITGLVINCSEEYIHYLLRPLSILNAIVNSNIVMKNLSIVWKFNYLYLPVLSPIQTNDLINYYSQSSENTIDHLRNSTSNITDKSDFASLRIICDILVQESLSFNTESPELLAIRDDILKSLLVKVVGSPEIDKILLTSLLIVLFDKDDFNEDQTWIIDTFKGQHEHMPPAIMNYLSCPQLRYILGFDDVFLNNGMSYSPKKILKTKFNLDLAGSSDFMEEACDDKVALFYVLKQYPDTPYERLVAICRTLNVSVDDGLSLQLISILTTWELQYKVCNDLSTKKIHYMNDENDLFSKCYVIWESISNKTFISDVLKDFWQNGEITLHDRLVTINPYYYEVYLCIYYLIFEPSAESRQIREYFLLHYLKNYTRNSKPKLHEFEMFSVKGTFPEIGHYRLPFHLFMREDMWSNLKSEITLETYKRWLPAVALLSLNDDLQIARDMICSHALKQTMTTRKPNENANQNENEPWGLITQEEPMLRAAHKCVKHISNMEWAGACLFYVLQGCARGADQVAAAQLCYQFAQKWAAVQPGHRAVRQMERLHATLSTRHALHKIDWACEELVSLTSEPTQLIRALYLHPNFMNKINRYDVNHAANEIADKNGINVSTIRIQILENILEKSSDSKNVSCLDMKELIIAKYILKATCPKMGAIYLSRIAFDSESEHNKCKKLRALQCLMSVVEPDTAVKVANQDRDSLWSVLLDLLYAVNLESVDLHWLVTILAQDKSQALSQLLQAVKGNIGGLRIAAEIVNRWCDDVDIVKRLIPLLLRSGLHDEVIPLLMKIPSSTDDLCHSAWRTIILTPFQRADYPITDDQKTKCLNVINLLPICPVIKDEDLKEIWKNCVRCKCFGMGCLILPYMTPQARQSLVELQKIDRRNLIASLKNLSSESFLVSGAMHVVEMLMSRSYKR